MGRPPHPHEWLSLGVGRRLEGASLSYEHRKWRGGSAGKSEELVVPSCGRGRGGEEEKMLGFVRRWEIRFSAVQTLGLWLHLTFQWDFERGCH